MIVADLKDPILNKIKNKFNTMLIDNHNVTQMSHYELEIASNREFSALEWRDFKLHPMVASWLDEEMGMIMKDRAFKLMDIVGENNSTATTQSLTAVLNYLDRKKDIVQNPTMFIYSFVPLSESEAQAPNVRTLENIPTEIKNAIVHIK